ncbi:TPA: hypothetical protein Q4A38_11810 [Synechococcus sp. WH 5701]|uniref:hypothetical protein n=1 Tax=Synechococcus sp. WH 5701 TaxID=69042 RepID=UPI0018DEB146|nr:hypothetical protein ICNINCKA_02147 [Synechococcus sp. CBW1107]
MTASARLLAIAVISCGTLACFPYGASAQNMEDDLIMHYCTNAVNAEVALSGKPAPAGLATYTCRCVVNQVNQRVSISNAKTICKQQAATKYGL